MTFAGCGKSKIAPPLAINGVTIDLPKLQRTCGSSSPTIRDSLDKVRLSIRYADYRTALEELGKLANNPDISEAQKKTISDVSEQVKQAFANATPNTADNAGQASAAAKPE
jgi:phosphopantothenate synthetase